RRGNDERHFDDPSTSGQAEHLSGMGRRKLSQWRGSLYRSVDDFVAAKAPDFHRIQQLSTSGAETVQHESVTNNKFQPISIIHGSWFGTRGSEVQILS